MQESTTKDYKINNLKKSDALLNLLKTEDKLIKLLITMKFSNKLTTT